MNEEIVIRIGPVDDWLDNGTSRTFTRAELTELAAIVAIGRRQVMTDVERSAHDKMRALIDSQLED